MSNRSPRWHDPFANVAHGPDEHFRLCFYAAILYLRDRLLQMVPAGFTQETFPFLSQYFEELTGAAIADERSTSAARRWKGRLEEWEERSPVRLPLVELKRAAGLDHLAQTMLFTIALPEEDPRFGVVFETLQGLSGQHRPTIGLLSGWGNDPAARSAVRNGVHALIEAGLVEVVNPESPRPEWALQPRSEVWDAIRGDVRETIAPWVRHTAVQTLLRLDELIISEPLQARLLAVPSLLLEGGARCVLVRGPNASGRRTILGAIASQLNRGVLSVSGLGGPEDDRWSVIGPLATVLHAMPVVSLEPPPGETIEVPAVPSLDGPMGIALPLHGGVAGAGVERAVTVVMPMPDVDARAQHWKAALGDRPVEDLVDLAESYRMTGGTIRRVAEMAAAEAGADGRRTVTARDAVHASRSMQAQLLDTLAARVPVEGDWTQLVVGAETRHELDLLERRCRRRERLANALPGAYGLHLGAGVKAMFTGPSGTGKTLAARLLASILNKDLYRLDLSAVVNKYLGETEKNIDRVLSRAEALDVMLLIDEGDALLSKRTDVQTSNDRYANLETNYLLQRLESYEGVLVVTTNAEQRIDEAFERRLDVMIDFPQPGPAERWAIWGLHLGAGHRVEDEYLRHVAARCALTGGQIRNAVLHASLVALEDGMEVGAMHIDAAVRREYRKAGAACPLRPMVAIDA